MGKVRPVYVKRTARILLEKYPDKFTTDFEYNKKVVGELLKINKKVRNRIAGYVTRLVKRQRQVKAVEEMTLKIVGESAEGLARG